MKTVALLGSTGSIGRRALEILALETNSRFQVVALAAGSNVDLLEQQIHVLRPRVAAVAHPESAGHIEKRFPGIQCFSGGSGLADLLRSTKPDVVISAISGTVSLAANLIALEQGARLCLANKETLVAAGSLVRNALDNGNGELLPVDSEHSAIFQCLQGQPREAVSRLLLTASGGPFFRRSRKELTDVTIEMALNHPTWKMGRKITIDSATLMNKALELIEAAVLFQVGEREIEVVFHPQSVVHSMVEFRDGSVMAQLGVPDMGLPIHYALNFPDRIGLANQPLRIEGMQNLEFFEEKASDFPSLPLARCVVREGKNAGAVFNAANEAAVDAFLEGRIAFTDIFSLVEQILSRSNFHTVRTMDDVTSSIEDTRVRCQEWISRKLRS